MKDNLATLCVTCSEKLDQAPHVLAHLLDLLNGTSQPSPAQCQHIGHHLAGCIHCQVLVEISLLAIIEDAQKRGEPAEDTRKLLALWSRITHATFKDEIPAYVDVCMERGEQEAGARFPLLADHVQRCMDCQAAVRDLCLWLTQLT